MNAKPLVVTVAAEVEGATVVVVSGATVVLIVGATVVVVSANREIALVEVFAGKLFDLAIFNFKTHDPLVPIINFVGFLVGVKVHKPVFDQVFTPVEFVETTVDKFTIRPALKEETFHVMFVDGAAATEPLTAAPARALMKKTATNKRL